MMPLILQITLVIFCLALLYLIVNQISKSRVIFSDFNYWIIFTVFLLLIALFPQLTNKFSAFIGIQTPVVAVFLVVVFLLILLVLSCAFRISVLNRRTIQLTQKVALMEEELCFRISALEAGVGEDTVAVGTKSAADAKALAAEKKLEATAELENLFEQK